MTADTIELDPEVAEAAEFAQAEINRLDYGEITLRFALHDGLIAFVEKSVTIKRKLIGRTRGDYASRR